MSHHISEHPSLQPFDISEYKGLRGKNFYDMDPALQRMVDRYSATYEPDHKQAMVDHIRKYGELVGGILDELTEECHKEGKYGEVVKYDRTGKRIDFIKYSEEQKLSRKISYDHGVVNLDFHPEWRFEFTHIHRYALTYLMNLNGEGGVACPLAMTDGMILALKKIGTDEQKNKYLPLVAGKGSNSHFMAGQYVTERVGGSNVSANRTIAKKLPNGKWELTGEKWFCSNPGDLWVTTAKMEGTNTVGMFLVPRIKDNGELNGHHILRKKDIIGSRGKITVEIIYDKVEAEEFGRPGHGLVNLIRYIIKTSRLHVGLGSCGNARRSVMEASEYAKYRTAYGKKILEFPSFVKTLAEMQILQTANCFVNFRSVALAEKGDEAAEITVPLLKYKSSSHASYITQKAILTLGGNGIIGDFSPLPRLHNDSIINETWEGTHLIITDHCLHALQKPKVYAAFQTLLDELTSKVSGNSELETVYSLFQTKRKELEHCLKEESKEWKDMNRVYIADLTYNVLVLAELLEQTVHDIKENLPTKYLYFAKGYTEMVRDGLEAPRQKNGVFFDPNALKTFLSF
ncbi:acyl-CoA dehydrogenase, C-terminal domain protein [Leptospira yanagawae serovar Saopaulo str. Sao Paulo = ATCC 700523]|uniref:Acyl-CoA dehydrogenase, C-terminal domain protein n=1 Tax=Leptospira yanagawae serovar Saopaulo str. Sao Paulo = ATCC 700523 TaxID=1249483 RepID=A0A5E8HDC6_9LEPT|nr:acyl-CoA dehydrogenase family protein [Leptospira yanagawae]EOQ88803.1 acyl-CoA dehydrogenase, C-terminal domain protein [Leptospira yanagawae serovar Saopaulo str. Sao Paulo = ATCC 700523]